jgi:tRNA pseudouridine55 synthase
MDISGAIFIDKPPFVTSYDVIRELKQLLPVKKIGHTGTLDPIATGLMILLIGSATKLAGYFLKLNKVYNFTVKFGEETDTLDSSGVVINRCDYSHIQIEKLKSAVSFMQGTIEQYPPIYSAVKYRGKPLYVYARRGETVELKPRNVKILKLSIDDFNPPYATFTTEVSSGTYIRAMAKSIGELMGCFAHVTSLRRLSIGGFKVEQAFKIEDIKQRLEGMEGNYNFLIDKTMLLNKIKGV